MASVHKARFLRAGAARLLAFEIGARLAPSSALTLDCRERLGPDEGMSSEPSLRWPAADRPEPGSIKLSNAISVGLPSDTVSKVTSAPVFPGCLELLIVSDLGIVKVTFVEPTCTVVRRSARSSAKTPGVFLLAWITGSPALPRSCTLDGIVGVSPKNDKYE